MTARESDDVASSASASESEDDGDVLAATLPDLALLLVFEYVAADNLDDLVSAGQVCRHWRRVAASQELWRRRRLKSHGMATQAFTRVVAFAPLLLSMDVCWINQICPEDRAIRKQTLVSSPSKLCRLHGVTCHRDPEWTLQLLSRHAPHLRELEVSTVDRDALRAIASMPRLRILLLSAGDLSLEEDPYVFEDRERKGGLEGLEVRGIPRVTTISLLHTHRRTLRRLTLNVGTGCSLPNAPSWPKTCNNLTELFQACGLKHLQELTLTRYVGCYHTHHDCMQQRTSLQHCLGVRLVKCSDCSPYI